MLRAMRRPSATARGSRENWSSSSTMSAIPLVIWLPEPIATAIRARFSAGHVVDAVADHRREAARWPRARHQRLLLLGADAAEDRVALGDRGKRGAVGGQLVALDHAGVRRDADRGGDRGHRLARVARDQLQVHLLLAHELDRLARRRGAASPRARSAPGRDRRRRLGRGVGGQRALGAAEGDDAAPRARVRLEAAAAARAAVAAIPARRARLVHPARRSRRRPCRSGSARSTSTPTRRGPRPRRAQPCPG